VRSLRARFFLISWPLVVAAVAAVAFGLERWTVVQLEQMETGPHRSGELSRAHAFADSVGARWSSDSAPTEALVRELSRTAPPGSAIVVFDTAGVPIAATDSLVRVMPRAPGARGHHLRRTVDVAGRATESELMVSGVPIRDARGTVVGDLVFLPPMANDSVAVPNAATRRADLRRRIWITALAASLAAAAAALLLAGPIVRRIRRLATAATQVGAGNFATRVDAGAGDELGDLGRSFNQMAERLDQAETHKRNLVGDVAHELRTPLTNLMGLVEAMQDGLRTPDPTTLGVLGREIGLLAALVNELQDLSLAESGQLHLDLRHIDAAEAAREAVDAIRSSSNGVVLEPPAPSVSATAIADPRRLAQVFRNLLANAVAHTPAGGRVAVSVTQRSGRVFIAVADSGRGIPRAHHALIFERFHRVDPSRDRASGGMGLGLALVRQLVQAMGGSVTVASEVGKGSTFTVELPG
jgi:signal transduction histidine kinase